MTQQSLKQRVFPISIAKAYVVRIYNRNPSPDTWKNWREWAGISKGRMYISFDQFCFLAAIATIRVCDRYRELNREEVEAMANSLAIQEPLAQLIYYIDSTEKVVGGDAIDALKARGIETTLRDLYRKVPKFSKQTIYPINYLFAQVC